MRPIAQKKLPDEPGAQPKGRRKPPLVGLRSSATLFHRLRWKACCSILLAPEFLIPFVVFRPGYLSIPSCGIEAAMPEMLLKKPQPIA